MEDYIKDIQRYIDGIESQHRAAPKFMALLTAILEKIDPSHAVAKNLPRDFDVHTAIGQQLDIIGQLVGIDRRFPPVTISGQPSILDDETFRKVILAKIVQNQWDGSYERFYEIWDASFRGILDASIYDNQDMSMDIKIKGEISSSILVLIIFGYIIPKPMGVRIRYRIEDEASPAPVGTETLAGCVARQDRANMALLQLRNAGQTAPVEGNHLTGVYALTGRMTTAMAGGKGRSKPVAFYHAARVYGTNAAMTTALAKV